MLWVKHPWLNIMDFFSVFLCAYATSTMGNFEMQEEDSKY